MSQIVLQRIKMASCSEEVAEVVGLKSGEVKIQDFEFVEVIEKCIQILGIYSADYGI